MNPNTRHSHEVLRRFPVHLVNFILCKANEAPALMINTRGFGAPTPFVGDGDGEDEEHEPWILRQQGVIRGTGIQSRSTVPRRTDGFKANDVDDIRSKLFHDQP